MDRRAFLKGVGASAGVAGVGGAAVLSGSRGDIDRVGELPDDGVEILTDEFDVSHVYGTDGYSVGYGQGYAQARDRLFQLDLLRRVARGESASLIGPSQVESDIEVKRDLYSDAELREQWEDTEGESRELVEGFADGVTDRMAEMEAAGELPGEFTLLGREPDPWDPLDTVAVIAYFIGFFGVSGGDERPNAATLGAMFDRFEDDPTAWNAYGDINEVVATERHYGSLLASEIEPTDERALEYDEVPDDQLAAIEAARDTEPWGVDEDAFDGIQDVFRVALGALEGAKFGSNAVIVGGEHTETGQPMLAGGPQLGLLKPPVGHEIGLHGGGFDVVGIAVVGTPGIIVGRTPEFAWTGTSARDDTTDTIAVDLDPDDHSRYEWDGQFHEFATEEYVHEPNLWAGVVDGTVGPERVDQEVAYVEQEGTRMPVVAYNESDDVAFVTRTATRMQELDGALQWLRVGRADSREEFEAVLEEFPFGFNFLYADDEDIGFYRTGTFPEREDGGDPRFPMPQTQHAWDGVDIGREIGAWQANPERGYVVNWNNAPGPGWRSPDGEFEWRGAHRVDVLDRLVRERVGATADGLSTEAIESDPLPPDASGNLTLEDVEAIIEEASVQHPFAPQVVPHLVAAARASDDDRLGAMADELEAWAGAENVDRWTGPTIRRWTGTEYSFRPGDDGRYPDGGMAIYEAVRHELQDALFADRLGPEAPTLEFDPTAGSGLADDVDPHIADHGPASTTATLLVDALEGETTADWLGDDDTTSHLQAALRGAADRLENRFDSADPGDWRLENRVAEFFPLGGANADTIHITNRASYQQAIAHGEETVARSILPPGNSGHLNRWELLGGQFGGEPDRLTSQLDRYERFEYTPHPIERERVADRAVDSTRLG